jgi:hypothetical protein
MEKGREKYHMVYGIVPYGIGIVPYCIWYRTVWYWTSGWKICMCKKEACLLQRSQLFEMLTLSTVNALSFSKS